METKVIILINKGSRRFVYVCEVLFRHILKIPYQFVEKSSLDILGGKKTLSDEDILLNYTGDADLKGLYIPNSGLLNETIIRKEFPEIEFDNGIPIFFKQKGKHDISFDLFAACFYLVTEYEFAIQPQYDQFGRYNEKVYPSFQHDLHTKPLVHVYAEILWEKINALKPSLQRKTASFDYRITIDVDHPWAFKHKGIKGVLGSFKDVFQFDFKNLAIRWKSLFSEQDPYDTFEEILTWVPIEKLKFFFLINREHKLDGRYTYRNKHYRKLIKGISKRCKEIGIHPSYSTFLSKQAISMEKAELEEIIGKRILSVRQHYLKYRNPKTRLFYTELGLRQDYNAAMSSSIGFRNGMGIPFPWFNLLANEMTTLFIHPQMVMDVTLKDYMGLSAEESIQKIINLIEECKKYNLTFSLLWHNSSLSEIHGWEGWKLVFQESVRMLNESTNKAT